MSGIHSTRQVPSVFSPTPKSELSLFSIFSTLTNTDHTNVQNATLGSLGKLKGGLIRGLSRGLSNVTNTSARIRLHPERTDILDEDNADNTSRRADNSSRRGVGFENFGSHGGRRQSRSDLNFFSSGEDLNSEQMAAAAHEDRRPNPRHQDLLRTMDLHRTLIEALNIDYNLAFMGARCTSKEKVKSREVSTTFSMSRSRTTPRPHEPINPSPRQPRRILAFHYPLVPPPPPNNPL